MRTKALALRRTISVLINRKYATREHRCDAHMNELPVPCGPWDPWYKKKQSYYNKVLVFGTLCFYYLVPNIMGSLVKCIAVWQMTSMKALKEVNVLNCIMFLFSFGMMIYTGSFYLNWGPPAQPGPPSDMIEECEDIES